MSEETPIERQFREGCVAIQRTIRLEALKWPPDAEAKRTIENLRDALERAQGELSDEQCDVVFYRELLTKQQARSAKLIVALETIVGRKTDSVEVENIQDEITKELEKYE